MKYLCHVPTEQYGFVSVDVEGTVYDAVEAYKELQKAWKGEVGAGLPHREFCKFIDSYVTNGTAPENGLEQWEQMDARQKDITNEIKKCFARVLRNGKE